MSKRMKLISETEFNRLKALDKSKVLPIVGNKKDFFSAQDEGDNLLNENNLPDDIKSQLYGNLLRSFNSKLNSILKPSIKEEQDVINSKPTANILISELDTNLLKGLPNNIRWKGTFILSVLKKYPEFIVWNSRGNCSFFKEDFLENSNIIDLLRYAVSAVKSKNVPEGINRFLFIIKLTNIPHSILSLKLRQEFEKGTTIKPRGARESTQKVLDLEQLKTWELFNNVTERKKPERHHSMENPSIFHEDDEVPL